MKIDSTRLKKILAQELTELHGPFHESRVCIGESMEGFQVQLVVTRDKDSLMEDFNENDICVSDI